MLHIKDLKRNKFICSVYSNMVRWYYSCLTIISPTLNTKVRYRKQFGENINLKNPKTLNEKLLWLKLNTYYKNPLVSQCADKYAVREYVEQRGCGDTLNELIGVYDSADEIPFENLPEKFVLKWNFGASMNIVCNDKSKLNRDEVVKQLAKWGKNKYWLPYSEMQYKYIPKKIVCEKYLEDGEHKVIPDYKVYCFNGEPLAIFMMTDRGGNMKTGFFDKNWQAIENSKKYESLSDGIERPKCLEYMLDVSRKLSNGFPFVRCDYYVVNGKLIFGELTFTPAGGFYTSQTKIQGKDMAEYLIIDPSRNESRG